MASLCGGSFYHWLTQVFGNSFPKFTTLCALAYTPFQNKCGTYIYQDISKPGQGVGNYSSRVAKIGFPWKQAKNASHVRYTCGMLPHLSTAGPERGVSLFFIQRCVQQGQLTGSISV